MEKNKSIFSSLERNRFAFSFFTSAVTLLFAYLIDLVTGNDGISKQVLSLAMISAALVISPIIETIAFQALPHFILSKLKVESVICKLFAMSAPFALAHDGGLAAAIYPLSGGLVFGATYIVWTKISNWDAILVVAAAHFFHNLIAIILMFVLGGTFQANNNM